MDLIEYDVRFKTPSTFILAGASMSGKTTFTFNLLRNIDLLFEGPERKQNVIYYYKQWQNGFNTFSEEKYQDLNQKIVREWVNKLPTTADIIDKTLGFQDKGGSVVVIDDFAHEIDKSAIGIFTRAAHHTNSVIILLSQNIFNSNKVFREISLNTTYVVIFKNPRDASQITHYAKQFSPNNIGWVVKAFHEATRRPHSYVIFDNHQTSQDKIRMRSHILPTDFPPRAYFPDEQ